MVLGGQFWWWADNPIRQDLLMKYSTYKTGHIYIPRCTYKDIREPSSCLKWHHKDKYPFNGPTLDYWDHHRQSTFSNFNWYHFCRWIVKRMKIENKRKEAENECFVIRINVDFDLLKWLVSWCGWVRRRLFPTKLYFGNYSAMWSAHLPMKIKILGSIAVTSTRRKDKKEKGEDIQKWINKKLKYQMHSSWVSL